MSFLKKFATQKKEAQGDIERELNELDTATRNLETVLDNVEKGIDEIDSQDKQGLRDLVGVYRETWNQFGKFVESVRKLKGVAKKPLISGGVE